MPLKSLFSGKRQGSEGRQGRAKAVQSTLFSAGSAEPGLLGPGLQQGCPQSRAGGTLVASLRRADITGSGAEAPLQRPRPGHIMGHHPVSDQGLEGRGPGLRAPGAAAALRNLKPEGPVKPPFPLLALAERSQHRLLGTRVAVLLSRWTPSRAGPLLWECTEAPIVLQRRDLDGHWAGDPSWRPGAHKPPLRVTLPGTGKIRPRGGLKGRCGRKAHPRLCDYPLGLGSPPVPQHLGEGSCVDAPPLEVPFLGPGETRPQVRASLGQGLQCGLR